MIKIDDLMKWVAAREAQPAMPAQAITVVTPAETVVPALASKTRKRANTRALPSTYAKHVADHLERTREYPSEADDKDWAERAGLSDALTYYVAPSSAIAALTS